MTISRKDLMEQDEFWVLLFILGSVLLNWPILSLAAGGDETSGRFSILVYIISVWLVIILSAYLFDRWTSN
ncbi:hypothetical protein [Methanocrinis sp.]|uniref:hypothetical protein n=1 Tax=Methanocrinis sp. TaxID=3101522 RepID=UPI003D0AD5AA